MPKQINRKSIYLGLLFLVPLLASAAYLLFDSNIVSRLSLQDEQTLREVPTPIVAHSRLLIGGDVFLGRSVERKALNSELKYEFPFQNMDTLELDKYQAVIANLECPSTAEEVPFEEQATYLKFNCMPEFLPSLSEYFDIVSLSNNHTDNVNGELGLIQTRENLEKNDIQYFGHFDNSKLDELCEVVAIDAKLIYEGGLIEAVSIPVVFCGYHGVFAIPLDEELAVIEEYAKFLPIIVMPHMGAEYVTSSDSIRERIYRQMIDNGADIVAGGHPHWVQNTESYKGKLIIFSMGNLIFDQQANQEVQRSLMLDLHISVKYNENTAKWLDLAKGCAHFQDNCIALAESMNLKKLEVTYLHNIIGTELENMVVQKADTPSQNAIEARANWNITSGRLSEE